MTRKQRMLVIEVMREARERDLYIAEYYFEKVEELNARTEEQYEDSYDKEWYLEQIEVYRERAIAVDACRVYLEKTAELDTTFFKIEEA